MSYLNLLNVPFYMLAIIIPLAIFLSIVLEEFLFRTANKKKILDNPGGRRLHKGAIPRVGGWSFFIVMAFTTMLILPLFHPYTVEEYNDLLPFLFGTGTLFIVGVVDDVENLGSKIKLFFQVVAATPMVIKMSEFKIYDFCFMDIVIMGIMVFVTVWIINAMNLIDGIDGLSSTIGILVMGASLTAIVAGTSFISYIVCMCLFISLVVFWFYNMQKGTSRRKMFMGDAGSLVMGFIISIIVMHHWMHDISASKAILPVTLGLLFIPLIDVFVVSITRYVEGRNPFKADLSHLHHKFLYCGLSAKKSLVCIVSICLLLAFVNYELRTYGRLVYLSADAICTTVMYLVLWYNKRKLSQQIKRHWDYKTGMYVEDLEVG